MSLAENIFDKAKEQGRISDGSKYFSVVDKSIAKLPNGEELVVDVPNGDHKVKIISEKIDTGKSFDGKEIKQLQLVVLDNGVQKLWNMPLTNQDGTLYFLIEKLKEIKYLDGEEFIVRAKKLKTGKYSKEIIRLSKGEEIPSIDYDKDDFTGSMGTTTEGDKGESVSDENFPF